MNRPLVWLVLFLVVSPLYAQKVGDELVVIAPSEAKLTVDGRTVATVPRGGTVTVEELGKIRFRVNQWGVSGWIAKQDVLTAADAIGFFSRAIDKKPSAADYRGRGNAWSCKGDNDKAIADYTAAIRLNPKEAVTFYDRGLAYENKGDHGKAIADYTAAIQLNPKDADAFCDRGIAYENKGDHDKAISDFTEAIQLDPKSAEAYIWRGVAYESKGDNDKGITDLNEAIRLNPKYAEAYFNRGWAYGQKGDFDKAITDYTEAIRVKPKYAKAYCNRGIEYGQKGDLDKAIADCTAVIRLDPKDFIAYGTRGCAYRDKGDYGKAISDYTEAIRLNPKYAEAYHFRGLVYQKKGDQSKAIADYTKAIQLDPKFGDAHWNRGDAYGQKGDYEKAVADYSEFIRFDPENADGYLRCAWAYDQKGDQAKAVADLDAAIKLKPDSSHYYEKRAALWIGHGEYEKGIKDLQTAIRLNPKDPAAKFEDWPKAPLSAEALEHGRRQVAQMLKDRPAMGQYGKRAEWLYQWAARKFAGEDLHDEIFWNDTEPLFDADNHSPTPQETGYIRVRPTYREGPDRGKKRSFEELWVNAVFELYNITGVKDFRHADDEAADGTLSKEQYVTKYIKIESRGREPSILLYSRLPPLGKRATYSDSPQPLGRSASARTRARGLFCPLWPRATPIGGITNVITRTSFSAR